MQLWPQIPTEGFCFHSAENDRNPEKLCGLRESHDVVNQHLSIDAGYSEEHLRLVIDQRDYAVIRGEQSLLGSGCEIHVLAPM